MEWQTAIYDHVHLRPCDFVIVIMAYMDLEDCQVCKHFWKLYNSKMSIQWKKRKTMFSDDIQECLNLHYTIYKLMLNYQQ